ncbi:MAG: Fur family zinc uptake transcriptional regulator [Alphaproteobacteria bacterium]|jgi:Fur family zinc uptake transcriptional regulator
MAFGCHLIQHQECINSAMRNAEMICQEKNIKLTKLRKSVLELIWTGHTPQKAYDLLTIFQKEDPAAKPATIYRTLDFLQENGLVHRINRLNAYIGCVNPNHKEPYFLMVCLHCNNVEESTHSEYRDFFNKMINHSQFQCSNKVFEIEGTCQNCL